MPFKLYSDQLPAGVLPLYDPVDGISALTYGWQRGRWEDALDGGSWKVRMCLPRGRHLASYAVARILVRLKEAGYPTFGHLLVAWRKVGRGTLVEVGLLWSEADFLAAEPERPPWMGVGDLTSEALLEARDLSEVEEIMES